MLGFDIGGLLDCVVDSVSFIADKVSDGVDYVVTGGAKCWNGFTGRIDFDEAERLYESMEQKYNDSKKTYEEEVDAASKKIEIIISSINYHKTDIYQNHFARFINLAKHLHNLTIDGENFLEYFDSSILDIKTTSGVRGKKEVFSIDFNNLGFSTIAFGILTLGFSTRKLASESLCMVKEEQIRVNEEMQKMKSQIVKMTATIKSIESVEEYFSVLICNYEKLLSRFEYGIKSQTQKNLLKGIELVDGKLDFKLMPIAHIEEFQALFNLSIVLKQMATMGYLTDEGEFKKEDLETVNNIKDLVGNAQLLAA